MDDATRPYFLWWTDATVGDLRRHLASAEPQERAYWLGALLREANTRDVWWFVTPAEVRQAWPDVVRFLGRTRARWAWLLGLPRPEWPPAEARRACGEFPTSRLPEMLEPLSEDELRTCRAEHRARLRRVALGGTD